MDALIRSQFFSRQGKATTHFFNGFKTGHARKQDQSDAPVPDHVDPLKLLEKLIKDRTSEEKSKEKQSNPSSAFKSKSRDFSMEPSESPGVGHYSPRYTALDSRLNQGPKYFKTKKKKKLSKIYLPSCLNSALQCTSSRPKDTSNPYGPLDPLLNRTVLTVEEFENRLDHMLSLTPIPEKPQSRIAAPIQFSLQRPREPFVKPDSGPNEKRFEYIPNKVDLYRKFQRPQSVDFSKMSDRPDYPVKTTVGPYKSNAEVVMPKLVRNVPDFSKQIERKSLAIEHLLKSPDSPDLMKYNMAYAKQGNVKGPKKLPLMKTLTARDDSMYKVTEAYSLNSRRSASPF